MIIAVTAKNFRAIKSVEKLPLSNFHVLVGANAAGKSTFLDVFEFTKSCLENGLSQAVRERVPEYRDLTFMRKGGDIEIELWIDIGKLEKTLENSVIQYSFSIGEDKSLGISVKEETLVLYQNNMKKTGFLEFKKTGNKRLLGKTTNGRDFFLREVGTYKDSYEFGRDKLTLASTPADKVKYPTANVVKAFLMHGIQYIQLNSRAMRNPCPATRSTELELDGTNLARVVGRLRGEHEKPRTEHAEGSEALVNWTSHLRYALDDLEEIEWGKREPDNAEYILLKYSNGLRCPSWLLSDGTLRMLALTLSAFLPPSPKIYMIEEPENGVHPKALEVLLQALSSIPSAQMFLATHSPLVVQLVPVQSLLCFKRDDQGTHIVPGNQHPILRDWNGVPDIASIFSSRILE
jgi:predicted ATPase